MFKSKHLSTFVFMAVAILAGGTLAYGVQGPLTVNTAVNPSGYYNPLKTDKTGALVDGGTGTTTALAVSGVAAVIKTGVG